jgi:phosphoglycolate phosphatase-like HAD superfamily hydrolase
VSKDVILVDIDHTITDAAWRDHLIGGEGGWDHYHSESEKDKPATDICSILAFLSGPFEIVAVTARPEKWRQLTHKWCTNNFPFVDEILMRANDDYSPSPEVKLRLVEQRFGPNWQERVACIIDDRDDVTSAFKEAGVTVLQCHARRYE